MGPDGLGVEGLGSPVVAFYPFSFWAPVLTPNSSKKGTLIIKGLLGNLGVEGLGSYARNPKPPKTLSRKNP